MDGFRRIRTTSNTILGSHSQSQHICPNCFLVFDTTILASAHVQYVLHTRRIHPKVTIGVSIVCHSNCKAKI